MTSRLRLADLLTGLSAVVDLGYSLPAESAMRACLVGTALARQMGVSEEEAAEVFYVSLLFHVGCLAYSHETAAVLGDDVAVHRAVVRMDSPVGVFTVLLPELTRGLSPAARLKAAAVLTARGPGFAKRHDLASCETARATARRIGRPGAVSDALYDVHEWWNGRGARGLRGEEIAQSARIARVATEAAFRVAVGGQDLAMRGLRRWAGRSLDPNVVRVFSAEAFRILSETDAGDPRTRILEFEPEPVVEIDEKELPTFAAAFADLADLKSPFLHGHSGEVARLSVETATRLGLDRSTTTRLEVAALLHDLGRAAVSNAVWDKPGPLTRVEWEQVRMHPYHSERILATSTSLAPMATIAGLHHERLDGTGYHRGCGGADIVMAARILAAADTFQAMTQTRPHRPRLDPDRASDELAREARARRLDADAVSAVLDVAGQRAPTARRDLRPAGLSEREVEVLRLVAAGCSNPDIGRRLGISRRTAEHHVQHIYNKLGVSSRPAAALFALEHDLLHPTGLT
jgi:HD-GYP domain-containing protein (c-di-GMP phosphodiesterase class II)